MLKRALGQHTGEEELTEEDRLSQHSDSVMDYGRRTSGRGNNPCASVGMETNIKETFSCKAATLNESVTKFCIANSVLSLIQTWATVTELQLSFCLTLKKKSDKTLQNKITK